MARRKKIIIIYNDGGGGHRATAQALQEILHEREIADVMLVNPLEALFQPYDWFPRWTSHTIEGFYNDVVLAQSWGTVATTLYYGVSLANQLTYRKELIAGCLKLWAEHQPDLVISLLPGINHLLISSFEQAPRFIPFATINTDFQETFRYSWFPQKGHYYAIAGTERSYGQALRNIPDKSRTFRTSGMPVRAGFYAPHLADIAGERQKHGLHSDKLTFCVLYGGTGSKRMRLVAEWLNRVDQPLQVIFLCGRNRELLESIEALEVRYPRLLVPYTKEIPYYFDLADALIGKSGPGFISEALVRQRPLLIDRSSVMPQERYNLQWIIEAGVGIAFTSQRDFLDAVTRFFDAKTRAQFQEQCRRHENRAIFEIPDILQKIIA